jgi:hypothetical protein
MRRRKKGVQPAERGGLAHATRARRCRVLCEHAVHAFNNSALQAWGNRAPLTGATGLLCECSIATWVVGHVVRKSAYAAQRVSAEQVIAARRCCACESKLTAAEAMLPRTLRSARRSRAGRRERDRGTASCQTGAHPSCFPACVRVCVCVWEFCSTSDTEVCRRPATGHGQGAARRPGAEQRAEPPTRSVDPLQRPPPGSKGMSTQ